MAQRRIANVVETAIGHFVTEEIVPDIITRPVLEECSISDQLIERYFIPYQNGIYSHEFHPTWIGFMKGLQVTAMWIRSSTSHYSSLYVGIRIADSFQGHFNLSLDPINFDIIVALTGSYKLLDSV